MVCSVAVKVDEDQYHILQNTSASWLRQLKRGIVVHEVLLNAQRPMLGSRTVLAGMHFTRQQRQIPCFAVSKKHRSCEADAGWFADANSFEG